MGYVSATARHELLQKHMLDLGCSVIFVCPDYRPRAQVKWRAMAVVK